MISFYRYNFLDYEIEEILKNENDMILNTQIFKANDNEDYELVLRNDSFYIKKGIMPLSGISVYEKDLLIPSVAKIDLTDDHCLYVLLDASKNISDKRNYYIDSVNYLTTEEISPNYIKLLATTINFSDDDDFFFLCFIYSVYRLKSNENIDFNLYFRRKLEYYGYEEEDFINKVPFNNSTNPHFLKIVNLALEVLYNFATYNKLNLKEYSLTLMKLKEHYLKYFYSKIY